MSRRGRSSRSHLIELLLVAIAVAAIYLFLTNGGPSVFGRWFADLIGAP